MIRKAEMDTPIGQAAWFYFQTWMRDKHRQIPQVKSFMHSKFYGPFIRFANFVKQVRLPNPDLYIAQMVSLDMQPVLWTHDQVYANFLEYMDSKMPASQHVQITINTLFDLADDLGCEVGDIFNHINTNDLIQLIRQRKLSPWLLFHSDKFIAHFKKLPDAEKTHMAAITRPTYWGEKFKNHPELVDDMKKYAKELNL